ncbi:unnamed protein product [Didymodactylos carnosus]|nr:unnamed protein product [Didymodactylos carnosus]CAF4071722.1 unnamed protein product [Didymodactylos carnosus]
MKVKPKHTLEILDEKGFPVPKKQQLSNYLTSSREKLLQVDTSIIPDDDKPWVLKYHVECEDETDDDDENEIDDSDDDRNKFQFFVAIDLRGFPCLIIGTTDMIKQFHRYGFAVCTNEKEKDFKFTFIYIRDGLRDSNLQMDEQNLVLIADGSEAIRNAFSKVFGTDRSIVICWAHMRKRVEKQLCLVEDKNLHTEIMDDVDTLQLSKDKKTFEIATKLFLKRWKNQEQFIHYFSSEWLESKNGWYEGLEVSSTNNALEATNRAIKDEDTLRERLVLARFTAVLFLIVNKWSGERNPAGKDFVQEREDRVKYICP